MKKFIVGALIGFFTLFLGGHSYAIDLSVWISSNTATADTTKSLCTTYTARGILRGACVNTGVAGTLTLYNSNATATNPVAAIDTSTKGCQFYDVAAMSGVTYTNSATANVTILYQCY